MAGPLLMAILEARHEHDDTATHDRASATDDRGHDIRCYMLPDGRIIVHPRWRVSTVGDRLRKCFSSSTVGDRLRKCFGSDANGS